MTDDVYLIAITALLPLTALMLVLQVNPYQALVMRGILGAIAALVYALFGAADVALTEALVGTMLSITLYAVAVRSSMEMRLGWVTPDVAPDVAPDVEWVTADATPVAVSLAEALGRESSPQGDGLPAPLAEASEAVGSGAPLPATLDEALVTALRKSLKPHHLRLELLAYPSLEALNIALATRRIHTAVLPGDASGHALGPSAGEVVGQPVSAVMPYRLQTRLGRLYEILNSSLPASFAVVSQVDLAAQPSPVALPVSAPLSSFPPAQESP